MLPPLPSLSGLSAVLLRTPPSEPPVGRWRLQLPQGRWWFCPQGRDLIGLAAHPAAEVEGEDFYARLAARTRCELLDTLLAQIGLGGPLDFNVQLAAREGLAPRTLRLRSGLPATPEPGEALLSGVLYDVSDEVVERERLQAQLRVQCQVFDALPFPACVVDRQGRVRAANEGWQAMAGHTVWPVDFAIGRPYLSACSAWVQPHGLDLQPLAVALQALLSGHARALDVHSGAAPGAELRVHGRLLPDGDVVLWHSRWVLPEVQAQAA